VPKVRGRERHIASAAMLLPDDRLRHFWDGGGRLMNAYQEVLGLPEDAWDVFLLYDADARWEGPRPPAPRFWMHQLGSSDRPRVKGPYLDPDRFALEARRLLTAPRGAASVNP
jgi:hypothetical protein